MTHQFYTWIGPAGEAWLVWGIFLAMLKGAQASLMMNYQENVVSMVREELCLCSMGEKAMGKEKKSWAAALGEHILKQ